MIVSSNVLAASKRLLAAGCLFCLPLGWFCTSPSDAADALNILNYSAPGTTVDRTGGDDASAALSKAVAAANVLTERGEPACVYIPPGRYRVVTPPPAFVRAGCIRGDGPSQSTLLVDKRFTGDLFSWSEAWEPTTPGPMVVGLAVRGEAGATGVQNAFVFYDRNDQVFMDDVDVWNLHGRALFSGATRHVPQAYMRESHLRSLRFFLDGTPELPVIEFSSEGSGDTDATNEIRLSQVDVYGQRGEGVVIRNNGSGGVRGITFDALRIEGREDGSSAGDLLRIGDKAMRGSVSNLTFHDLELVDPAKGFAALHVLAPEGAPVPYFIEVQGAIDGGVAKGEGLRMDAGRNSAFHLFTIHTSGENVIIGDRGSGILLDGGGLEETWRLFVAPSSFSRVLLPAYKSR